MAFAVKWYWNSGAEISPVWTEFTAGNQIRISSGSFTDNQTLNSFQDAMHLKVSSLDDEDACASPHLTNVKFIDKNQAIISQKFISYLCSSFPLQANCIKVVIGDLITPTTFITTNGKLFFFDGITPATSPTGIVGKGIEQGDEVWTDCNGLNKAVSLFNQETTATLHSFYFAISAKPTVNGSQSATLRFSIDYDTGSGPITITSDIVVVLTSCYCDVVFPGHILATIAGLMNKPSIKVLSSYDRDSVFGDALNTRYENPREVVGLVLADQGYYKKQLREAGIETKATPAFLVPVTCKFPLGSRVFDPLTQDWYELVEEVDVIRHFDTEMSRILNYREYSLRKVQEADGGGV